MTNLFGRVSRTSWQINKAARTVTAYQHGGLPADGKQYLRRKATRSLFAMLGNGRRR